MIFYFAWTELILWLCFVAPATTSKCHCRMSVSAHRRGNSEMKRAKTICTICVWIQFFLLTFILTHSVQLIHSMSMFAAPFPFDLFSDFGWPLFRFRLFFTFGCDFSDVVGRGEFWLTLTFLLDIVGRFPFCDCSTQNEVLFFENWYLNGANKWNPINVHSNHSMWLNLPQRCRINVVQRQQYMNAWNISLDDYFFQTFNQRFPVLFISGIKIHNQSKLICQKPMEKRKKNSRLEAQPRNLMEREISF